MCRRAINASSAQPIPEPFGSCTRSHPRPGPSRLHAQPFCLCGSRGREGRGGGGRVGRQQAAGAADIKPRARARPASRQPPPALPRRAMETRGPSASGPGERAHRRRLQPAGPDRPTPRGGAHSGGRASPSPSPSPSASASPSPSPSPSPSRSPAPAPASPQLLPSALHPAPARGPRSAAGAPAGAGLASPPRASCPPPRRSAGFWRPWADARGSSEEGAPPPAAEAMPDSPGVTEASGKLSQYRHPVRLFWPKSKCYDYLYQEAEALLKNFPIQATISFYEDSDSEDEIEELICEN
uniref:Cytochrome b5 reductase 4 n=1 Tax=Canis lupus familiaris TaxID=9615 RepID=A0A8I3NWR2_CANLF